MSNFPIDGNHLKRVRHIVESRSVSTLFQPVVSISTKSIVGFEAFSRGKNGDVFHVDASILFDRNLPFEVQVDVDRLCREVSFGQFKSISSNHGALLLFQNINPILSDHVDIDSEILSEQVDEAGLKRENVVLECCLTAAANKRVAEFGQLFRDKGFKICLDNCSVGDSFLQYIARVKPNFVKINRTFFCDEGRAEYAADALQTLRGAMERVGGAVIAQGVETESESLRLLTSGVHLQQGYYYTKDEDLNTGDPARMFFQKIRATYDKFHAVKRQLVQYKKKQLDAIFKTVASISSKFSCLAESRYDDTCRSVVKSEDAVVSMFIVDEAGKQITRRWHVPPSGDWVRGVNILGTEIGVDHSLEDYIMYLDMGYEKFVTQPSPSAFVPEKTSIISRPFYSNEGLRYVVCVEMPSVG